MLEQIQGLEATAHRLAGERDEARADRAAAIKRAELAEAHEVALGNAVRVRDTEIRDLRGRLANTQEALDAATRPAQPPAEPEPAPPPPRVFDAPRRPVRRTSWRRPPRRH